MARFAIIWSSGKQTEFETSSDCSTADQYAMQRWGQDSADQVFKEFGTQIVLVEDGHPAIEKYDAIVANKAAVAAKTAEVRARKAQAAAPKK